MAVILRIPKEYLKGGEHRTATELRQIAENSKKNLPRA
jgi:hypothetical protein